MNKINTIPLGVSLFLSGFIILDLFYMAYIVFYFLFVEGFLPQLFSLTPFSLLMWIDVVLTVPALVLIPYGFLKRIQWTRLYAIILLSWKALAALGFIILTRDIPLYYILFIASLTLDTYLFLSPIKAYFANIPPLPTPKIFTYGEYTLYSRTVHLKNGKTQIIYFFSKKIPKSGTPSIFPEGYTVGVSLRSGLPFLRKNQPHTV